jgi:hypothetical protein
MPATADAALLTQINSTAVGGFHFADERFVPGEYASIKENGKMHTYRVAPVTHLSRCHAEAGPTGRANASPAPTQTRLDEFKARA